MTDSDMASTTTTSTTARLRLKAIALPPEHGAWGFLLEPIVLGLLVAPSLASWFLALAVVGAFLIRHPLKLAVADRQRGKRYARTALAEHVLLVYGALTVTGLMLAIALAGWEIMLPLLMALPLVLAMLASYIQNRGRDLIPELAGASALAATASGIALAGSTSAQTAFALWMILNARNLPSILYVRARLRLEKEKPFSWTSVFLANMIAVITVLVLVLLDVAPLLALIALLILFARALYGLSPYRRRVRTQTIGFLEMAYGLLVVIAAALGYAL
jgi:hypothetical protein